MITEWIEKGYFMPKQLLKVGIPGMANLTKALLKHPVVLIKANRAVSSSKDKGDWQTDPPYQIPKYRESMRYLGSDKRYLRPTHLCESRDPAIIALANELGAGQKSDLAYAESVFNFVKEDIKFTFSPWGSVDDTLEAGGGHCIHQLSVFAALCRAGGLPARYRLYSLAVVESMYENMVAVDPIVSDWYDALGYFMLHGTAEVSIDGEWVVADPTFTPAYEAFVDVPLAKLGDTPTGMWNFPVQGAVMELEGLPYGIAALWNLLVNHISPGSVDNINSSVEKGRKEGQETLAETGREEYDRSVRKSYKAVMPQVTIEKEASLQKDE